MDDEPLTANVYIDAPPQHVFEFLTRPEAIVTWMGERAQLDPTAGGRFEVDIKGAKVRGQFVHLDPPHRLLISWGYAGSDRCPPGASTVEIRLAAEGVGTRVVIHHRDLPSAEHPGHALGWNHYLARLQIAVAGDPGPDPGMPPPSTHESTSALTHTAGARPQR